MTEQETISGMISSLQSARDSLLSSMLKKGVAFDGTPESKAHSLLTFKKMVDKIVDSVRDENGKSITEFAKYVAKETYSQIDKMISEKIPSEEMSLDTSQWKEAELYAKTVNTKVTNMTSSLKSELVSTVNLAFLGSRTPEQVKKMISKRFNVSESRAETIVRTENKTLQNKATQDRYSALQSNAALLGVTTRKRWIHSSGQTEEGFKTKGHERADYNPRPHHKEMHGQYADENGFFHVTNAKGTTYKCLHPHDPALPAEEVVNCYCDFALEIVLPTKPVAPLVASEPEKKIKVVKNIEPQTGEVKEHIDTSSLEETFLKKHNFKSINEAVKPPDMDDAEWNAMDDLGKIIVSSTHGKTVPSLKKMYGQTPEDFPQKVFDTLSVEGRIRLYHAYEVDMPSVGLPTITGIKVKPDGINQHDWDGMSILERKIAVGTANGTFDVSLIKKPDWVGEETWEKYTNDVPSKVTCFFGISPSWNFSKFSYVKNTLFNKMDANKSSVEVIHEEKIKSDDVDYPEFNSSSSVYDFLGLSASPVKNTDLMPAKKWNNMSEVEKKVYVATLEGTFDPNKLIKVPKKAAVNIPDDVWANTWNKYDVEEKVQYLLYISSLPPSKLFNVNVQTSPATVKKETTVKLVAPPKPLDMGWTVWDGMSIQEKIEHVQFSETSSKELQQKKDHIQEYISLHDVMSVNMSMLNKNKPKNITKTKWDSFTLEEKITELKSHIHQWGTVKVYADNVMHMQSKMAQFKDQYHLTDDDIESSLAGKVSTSKKITVRKSTETAYTKMDPSKWFSSKDIKEMAAQKVRGRTVLVDSQEIEDNSMMVYRVIDQNGKMVNRIRFKLSKAASERVSASGKLKSNKDIDVQYGDWDMFSMDRDEDGTARMNHTVNWSEKNTYTISTSDGVKIRFADANRARGMATRGLVEVECIGDLDENSMGKMMKATMDVLGVETSPSSEEDLYLSYVAKHVKLYMAHLDPSKRYKFYDIINDPDTPSSQKVEKIKEFLPTDIQNALPSPDSILGKRTEDKNLGTMYWKRSDLTRDQIEKELKDYTITHSTGASLPELIDSFLRGQGQITSTEERIRTGIDISNGMSPKEDKKTGGASYFFTRIKHKDEVGRAQLEFHIGSLERADAYSTYLDRFGDMRTGSEAGHGDPDSDRACTIDDYKLCARNSVNETMFKNGMDINDLKRVNVRSATERNEIIAIFKKYGVKEIRGVSVENIVVISK